MFLNRFNPFRNYRYVSIILFINFIVFLLWNFTDHSGREPVFMTENFLVSWSSLREGRLWTLLTSAFSHSMFLHFFMNMYVLKSFGSIVEMAIGSTKFIKFYLSASLISSFCHAFVSLTLLDKPELPALGASGAVSGVVLLFSLLFPKERILVFGLIPIPALWGVIILAGLDLWGLFAQAGGGGLPIGHGAHLGGTLTGILYYFLFLKIKSIDYRI